MQFENTLADLLKLFTDAESGVFLLSGALITVLVQVVKNTCINKLKIDLTGKFDPTVLLPFIFGVVFAVVNFFLYKNTFVWPNSVVEIFVEGLSLGATSVMIYRVFSTFDNKNVKTLCKDGVFNTLYNQLLIVTDLRQQLLTNNVSLVEFLEKLSEATAGIKAIYGNKNNLTCEKDVADESNGEQESDKQDEVRENKLECLKTVLSSLLDEKILDGVAETLHKAFEDYFALT